MRLGMTETTATSEAAALWAWANREAWERTGAMNREAAHQLMLRVTFAVARGAEIEGAKAITVREMTAEGWFR